ncbi:MAG: GDP-mannose 4,6-dehydratase [Phormidesmis sp.]
MKTALICGISGQDGAYLAKLLLSKGYRVVGTSRDAQISAFKKLSILGIKEQVSLISMALTDFRSVLQVIMKVCPDEIYNLAGQSSVGLSFDQPVETLESIATGTFNLLEAIRFTERPIRFYNAGSGECFGQISGDVGATEKTCFSPKSPNAVAKITAFGEVDSYRDAYGVFACSGILFNCESLLRPERFVTQKIVKAAKRIANGSYEKLYLGNLAIQRDWGWAPEYVEVIYLMLQQNQPDDFVIATGESYSLEKFVELTFACLDLDWRAYVVIDKSIYRPAEILIGKGCADKAKSKLGWSAQSKMPDVVKKMLDL